MAEVLALLPDILRAGEDIVLARVVSGRGSTPREAGARMIIHRGGMTEGTVGGGLVEARTMEEAARIFESRQSAVVTIDMTAHDAAGTDMICGGRMEVFCEYVAADGEAVHVFDLISENLRLFRKNVLCTELEDRGQGMATLQRFLLRGQGMGGEAAGDLDDRLRDAAMSLSGSALVSVEGRRFCLDVIDSMESLYLFGAGHVAREVAALASHVGFRVIVLDDREEFASEKRFAPPIEIRVVQSFEGCFSGLDIGRDSYVAIVTRGHAHDKTVLAQALRTGAGYIGMIGSRRKRDTIYRALISEGFADEDLRRVHCPIGVPIDTETPEEIAVSIVGELIHADCLPALH